VRQPIAIHLGDVIEMRKPHACGANRWTVIRTGADIRVQCTHCGRALLMPRSQLVRAIRRIEPPPDADAAPEDPDAARPS